MFLKLVNLRQASVLSLILTNLVLFGVAVYYKLTLFDILLIFWGETLVVALFNFIKMVKVAFTPVIEKSENTDSNAQEEVIANVINFSVIFVKGLAIFWSSILISAFCLFQLVLLVELFGNESIQTAKTFPLQHFSSFLIGMVAVFVSHGISFFVNFIGKKEYQSSKLRRMILAPFRRILLVWIVIVAGAFILLKTESNSIYLLIPWFLTKLLFDLRQHLIEHKRNMATQTN